MSKSAAAMLVLFFVVVSCIVAVKPALSSSDVAEDSWVSKASMQVARSSLGVAVVNGKIYAIGGHAENGIVATNEEYDPATDIWVFKKPMPTPRSYFPIVAFQNKIYCIGGYLNNGSVTGVNEVYDPATDTWETREPMPTKRVGLKANAANGKIYLIGGDTNNFARSLNEVYDPASDSWTTKSSLPFATSSYASAVVDNKIYIIGGLTNSSVTWPNQIYEAETDTWIQGAASPSPIVYAQAAATIGVNAPKRIYVLSENLGTNKDCVLRVFDPRLDTWTDGALMPTYRREYAVAMVNDVFYAIGGLTTTYNSAIPFDWSSEYTLYYASNEQYTPFGYGSPDPSYDGIAPEFAVVSPENKTYYTADAGLNFTDITLDFTVDEKVFSVHYVLDGGTPVEISGNTTLSGLAVGVHNVTVFGFDASGNRGTSEILHFAIEAPAPFPTTIVATASGVSLAIIGVGLLVYFKKRKH